MHVFELILGVVGIIAVFVYVTVKAMVGSRANRAELSNLEREFEKRLRIIDSLEERVQVLEKIVTDRNYDLKRQFDDLETGTGGR